MTALFKNCVLKSDSYQFFIKNVGKSNRLVYTSTNCILTGFIVPGGGGKGGTLIFSSYVGLGPASLVHPKKNQEFQAPQKNI